MIYLLVGWLSIFIYVLYFTYKNWGHMVATNPILQTASLTIMQANKAKRRTLIAFLLLSGFVFSPLFAFGLVKTKIVLFLKKIKNGKN